MQLVIASTGQARCIYGETFDLKQLGAPTIRRASSVEPNSRGEWLADLTPVHGPLLGPFSSRSQALSAEVQWLADHWLIAPATPPIE